MRRSLALAGLPRMGSLCRYRPGSDPINESVFVDEETATAVGFFFLDRLQLPSPVFIHTPVHIRQAFGFGQHDLAGAVLLCKYVFLFHMVLV